MYSISIIWREKLTYVLYLSLNRTFDSVTWPLIRVFLLWGYFRTPKKGNSGEGFQCMVQKVAVVCAGSRKAAFSEGQTDKGCY